MLNTVKQALATSFQNLYIFSQMTVQNQSNFAKQMYNKTLLMNARLCIGTPNPLPTVMP